MSETFDTQDSGQLLEGMRKARMAIGRGQVVVIPTDTSYAVVADAFKPSAVQALRAVRAMAEDAPLGVFLPGIPTLKALAEDPPEHVQRLAKEFWPGALSLIVPAGESLAWDLGATKGTVALRMPSHRIALELLSETGPLVASQASLMGTAVPASAQEVQEMLGDTVAVYLVADAPTPATTVSTVIDATSLDKPAGRLRLVREGAIPKEDIFAVVPQEHFA
jgi:tRNA threonylcarbamoyl adenosine modification protein (Sua5/YciO/YrdC/YwlC family)